MIGLAVYLNGKKLTVAGAEDLGVLNTIVTAVGQLGKSTAPLGRRPSVNLHLSVGGLTNRGNAVEDEHLRWVPLRSLRVGDRVSVRIVRTDRASQYVDAQRKRELGEARKARLSRLTGRRRSQKRQDTLA
ncbi:MAG TPA: hypothetical protein VHW25_11740 [Steroidobacteraceae bacterium]|jgi:hypothetical protein|nr:hypothetical protein [Steroidobacteraceae bacterium]